MNHKLLLTTPGISSDLPSTTTISKDTLLRSFCPGWYMGFPFRARMDQGHSDLLLPQDAETCYLAHSLLKFYLNTVFKHYHSKIAKSKVLKSFSTLANNFMVIASKLQPSVSRSWVEAGECVLENLPARHPHLSSPGFFSKQRVLGVTGKGAIGSGLCLP